MGSLFPGDTDPTGGVGPAALRTVEAVASTASAAGAVPHARHETDRVVLVGGYVTGDPQLAPLREWLTSLGYEVTTFTTGYGIGCSTTAADALAARLRRVAAGTDAPVHVVGHSRGGQLARVAVHHLAAAGDVRLGGLITLGTPFTIHGRDLGIYALAYGTALLGSLGVPGLLTLDCLRGRCCRDFRTTIAAPWPADLPFTAVRGLADAVVPPRACDEPDACTVAVDTGHLGLLHDPHAFIAVADTLAAHTTRVAR